MERISSLSILLVLRMLHRKYFFQRRRQEYTHWNIVSALLGTFRLVSESYFTDSFSWIKFVSVLLPLFVLRWSCNGTLLHWKSNWRSLMSRRHVQVQLVIHTDVFLWILTIKQLSMAVMFLLSSFQSFLCHWAVCIASAIRILMHSVWFLRILVMRNLIRLGPWQTSGNITHMSPLPILHFFEF